MSGSSKFMQKCIHVGQKENALRFKRQLLKSDLLDDEIVMR